LSSGFAVGPQTAENQGFCSITGQEGDLAEARHSFTCHPERRTGTRSAFFACLALKRGDIVNDSPLTPISTTSKDPFAQILTEDETLVADARSCLSPSQQVEQKLIGILKASPLPVSHVQRRLKPGPR
jgi:hypothetical protein